MIGRDQQWISDVLPSTKHNGGGSRIPSTSILGHKRTGSGRIESQENISREGSTFSSPELSGGSGSKPQPHYSPIAQPISKIHRSAASVTSLRDPESPRDTKIPRPRTTAPNQELSDDHKTPGASHGFGRRIRQPIGLKAAFKLAEAQEARDRSGSSSSNGSMDLKQAFIMANAEANHVAVGSPSPAPRSYRRRGSVDTRSNQYFGSPNRADLGQRLHEFDRKHQLGNSGANTEGLFTTRGRVGPKVAETTTTLARKASNGSLEGSPVARRNGASGQHDDKQFPAETLDWNATRRNSLLPSVEFGPLPPVEIEDGQDLAGSSIIRPTIPSPEKSYDWNFDADFTAGDLQVSDSPRIKLGRNGSTVGGSFPADSPKYKWKNNKLDEIRELETRAANADIPEDESSMGPKRTNSKLDEIRAREMVASSPRILAEGRLEEIRARNAEARSRSTSPEEVKSANKQSPTVPPSSRSAARNREKDKISARVAITNTGTGSSTDKDQVSPEYQPPVQDDSYDLLRQLEQATSSRTSSNTSPKPTERQQHIESTSAQAFEKHDGTGPRSTREARQSRDMRAKSSMDRLTVGYAGLHKVSSGESIGSKRQSLHSETDPVDRIEAEKKLFDMLDNYSEKNSTRASSPVFSEKSDAIVDETPKANKRADPLSLPTPRVTGAYVETPATVKAERDDEWIDIESDTPKPRKATQGRHSKETKDLKTKEQGDEPSEEAAMMTGQPSASPTRRPKPRRRKQPLVNTANIPSVRDDIRAILVKHSIDDSTLDDFEGLLDGQDIDDHELEKLVDDSVMKIEEDMKLSGLTDRERELQTYDRMSKTLQTGLLGIRSAKQGIERLEDKVSHSEPNGILNQVDLDLKVFGGSASSQPPSQVVGNVTNITWPTLYRRHPRFRLTPLGMIAFLFTLWYTIESIFCRLYVEQYDCPRGMVCDWSPNEPYFPYAAPFMLDEWATGGRGRALTWRVGDELGDLGAEVYDWATGHDFTNDEVMYMNVWERKRHRRRLGRRGLYWKWTEPVQFRHKFQTWRNAWTERQRAIEEGEAIWIDESMSGDQRL